MIQLRERAWCHALTELLKMIFLGVAIWGFIYWLASNGNLPLWFVGI